MAKKAAKTQSGETKKKPFKSAKQVSTMTDVATHEGVYVAKAGDWIVNKNDGSSVVMTDEQYQAFKKK